MCDEKVLEGSQRGGTHDGCPFGEACWPLHEVAEERATWGGGGRFMWPPQSSRGEIGSLDQGGSRQRGRRGMGLGQVLF